MANQRRKRTRAAKPKVAGARSGTPLREHIKDSKRQALVPPMMNLPLTTISWDRELLPEMLWTAALMTPDWPDRGEHHRGLGALMGILDESICVDGMISSFSLVPKEQRAQARRLLRDERALPDGFLNAISLYPDGPAAWLAEDWLAEHEADEAAAVEYLKELVTRMKDGRDSYTAQLRLSVLGRRVIAKKLFFGSHLEFLDIVPKYPRDLATEDEKRKAESMIRAAFLAGMGLQDEAAERTLEWARIFWRTNWKLSKCEVTEHDQDDEEAEFEPNPEPIPTPWEVRNHFVTALEDLEQCLREAQEQITPDLYDPVADEVKLGLASRQVRLMRRYLEDPGNWTVERSSLIIRPMIDTRIVAAWLARKDDPALYQAYKEYGQGKLKLLKLQFAEHIEGLGETDTESEDYLRALHARVNEDRDEEFQTISLKASFTDRSIRQMAEDVGLKHLYSLVYAPLSGESHGDWGSVRWHDLHACSNPLHRNHRIGRFTAESERLTLRYLDTVISLMDETVEAVFSSYGVTIELAFDRFRAGLNTAAINEAADDTA
jgi:hypothetical protein